MNSVADELLSEIAVADKLRQVDEPKASTKPAPDKRHVWHTPEGKDLDLEFLVRDYVDHLRHHLAQVFQQPRDYLQVPDQ